MIMVDYPSMGDLSNYSFATGAAEGFASGTIKGVFDAMRAVDVLEAQPFVDSSKIAAIGHSLGGHNSIFAAVFDTRIKVIVSSCGWTPWKYYPFPLNTTWALPKYMPRIKDLFHGNVDEIPFDFYEIVSFQYTSVLR